MLVLCGLIIFELAVIAVLLFVVIKHIKAKVCELFDSWVDYKIWCEKQSDVMHFDIKLKMDAINASIDKSIRHVDDIKNDLDVKFGPDLIKQLNAIFKLKADPSNLVLGKDGKFHKVNRDY